MKKLLLFQFLLLSSLALSAQISFSPEAPEGSGDADVDKVLIYIDITNDLNENQATFWYIDRDTLTEHEHLVPSEWEFQVCDINTCYMWGREDCPEDRPAIFDANQTWPYEFKMRPNGVAGTGDVVFNITDADGNIIASIPVHYDITSTTSTKNIEENQLRIYPNPSSDFIQIENDLEVSAISFHNIIGKKISFAKHSVGDLHDVSGFQDGIYLVRVFDKNGDVITVSRFTKN